ncbi:MAG: hypothetical protein WCQ99_07260 [Pseudomonadota bacterium]
MKIKAHRSKIFFALFFLLATGCLPGGSTDPKLKGSKLLFSEAQKSLDARDYVDAISKLQMFLEQFPKAEQYSWALQRLGEAFEGLLAVAYHRRIENGEDQAAVAKDFLLKYGNYNCWKEEPSGIKYTLVQYKTLLEKFPDSPIADETEYRMIPWEADYKGRPEGIVKELTHLEAVLEKYPSTSLRQEILYKMAHRCRMLYEIHSFSPKADLHDAARGEQYRSKATYMYRLCLNASDQTDYAQKAWAELASLEEGKRIYILK